MWEREILKFFVADYVSLSHRNGADKIKIWKVVAIFSRARNAKGQKNFTAENLKFF